MQAQSRRANHRAIWKLSSLTSFVSRKGALINLAARSCVALAEWTRTSGSTTRTTEETSGLFPCRLSRPSRRLGATISHHRLPQLQTPNERPRVCADTPPTRRDNVAARRLAVAASERANERTGAPRGTLFLSLRAIFSRPTSPSRGRDFCRLARGRSCSMSLIATFTQLASARSAHLCSASFLWPTCAISDKIVSLDQNRRDDRVRAYRLETFCALSA